MTLHRSWDIQRTACQLQRKICWQSRQGHQPPVSQCVLCGLEKYKKVDSWERGNFTIGYFRPLPRKFQICIPSHVFLKEDVGRNPAEADSCAEKFSEMWPMIHASRTSIPKLRKTPQVSNTMPPHSWRLRWTFQLSLLINLCAILVLPRWRARSIILRLYVLEFIDCL